MFEDSGDMRLATSKSVMKNALEVTVSHCHQPDAVVYHAISGCDSTAQLFRNIGKTTVIKKLQEGHTLTGVGDINSDISDVVKECTIFVGHCYNAKPNLGDTMSDIRYNVWAKKHSKKT